MLEIYRERGQLAGMLENLAHLSEAPSKMKVLLDVLEGRRVPGSSRIRQTERLLKRGEGKRERGAKPEGFLTSAAQEPADPFQDRPESGR